MIKNLTMNDSEVCSHQASSEYEFVNVGWKGMNKNPIVALGPTEFWDDKLNLFLDLEMCKQLRDWLNAVIEEKES